MTSFRQTPLPPVSDADTKRTQSRDSLFMTARLRLPDRDAGFADVRVRNLSEGGLMVEIGEPVDMGVPVELEMRGLGLIRGRIAWYAEGRAGIALDSPIDPQRARKPIGQGTHTPGHTKSVVSRVR